MYGVRAHNKDFLPKFPHDISWRDIGRVIHRIGMGVQERAQWGDFARAYRHDDGTIVLVIHDSTVPTAYLSPFSDKFIEELERENFEEMKKLSKADAAEKRYLQGRIDARDEFLAKLREVV